jgi:hypothetical protein
MKSIILVLFILLETRISFAQDYRVHFIQDGVEVPIVMEHVLLAKKPFQIQVELLKVDGVYGSCSLSDSLFRIPLNQSLPESDLIQWKIAVEPEFNKDQDIIVSKDGYFYWFYNPKVDTWHRFDPNPKVEKGRVTGTKTISSLFISEDLNSNTKTLALSEFNQPLYLLYFLMDNKREKVSKRMRVQIEWTN